MAPTPAAKSADAEPNPETVKIGLEEFSTPQLSIPLAGLLTRTPELREQNHTPARWQALLDDYAASPLDDSPPQEND